MEENSMEKSSSYQMSTDHDKINDLTKKYMVRPNKAMPINLSRFVAVDKFKCMLLIHLLAHLNKRLKRYVLNLLVGAANID